MTALAELFVTPESFPFAVALAIVAGLFAIELIGALFGGSLLGFGGDGPDIDIDADFDLSAEFEAGVELDNPGIYASPDAPVVSSGLFTWMGTQDVPFLIWLASFLTAFGSVGFVLQFLFSGILGFALPALAAAAIVLIPALVITRFIANWVGYLMPKTESTATRTKFLAGRHGMITQGTAARGKPAEVKIKDRHDNIHYLRVEPLDDGVVFPQGSTVTLIRKHGDKFYVI